MRSDRTIYRGKRFGVDTTSPFEITVNGETLPLTPSLRIRSHSPDGFNFGYGGSGPSQLDLAILFDFTGDATLAKKRYMNFKFAFVARWGNEWEIDGKSIRAWLDGSHRDKLVS